MQPTQEQVHINTLLQTGMNVCVQAGAGTGKSSTLRYLAIQNPDKNFLVLCFNKANAEESNDHPEKPRNIYYSTVHSIAYRAMVDADMRSKLKNYLNYKDISVKKLKELEVIPRPDDQYPICRAVLDTITAYCNSDSRDLEQFAYQRYTNYLSIGAIVLDSYGLPIDHPELTPEQITNLSKYTKQFWLQLIDTGTKHTINHDVYLKLFQLREYGISTFWDKVNKENVEIDVLALDEAQDSNEVTIAIFENTKIIQKVVVGDDFQSIYQWRGAIGALDRFDHYQQGQLTTSFRFNNTIADMANVVLYMGDAKIDVTGANTKTSIDTKAILVRTNIDLLRNIYIAIAEGKTIYTPVDLKELFSKVYHVAALNRGEVPKYPDRELAELRTKDDLLEACALSSQIELLTKLTMNLCSGGLTYNINRIREAAMPDSASADVTISTIHKAKGLEWDDVTIDDGLIKFQYDSEGNVIKPEETISEWLEQLENLNLLYVAITRAKVQCRVPFYLNDLFGDN